MRRPKGAPQKNELQLAKDDLKGKQDILHMRELEFNVVSNMDMPRVNEILLSQNALVYEQIRLLYEEIDEKPREIQQNPKDFPIRTARADQYKEKYLQSKPDIYKKMTALEVKQLAEEFHQQKRILAHRVVEDRELQHKQYQLEYYKFLQSQPDIEYQRRVLLNDLAETHELMSALHNVPPFEKPTLWNSNPLSEQDKEVVNKVYEKHINQIERKYDYKQFELDEDKTDILAEVIDYLDANYFNV